jgi:hypothetical protein
MEERRNMRNGIPRINIGSFNARYTKYIARIYGKNLRKR